MPQIPQYTRQVRPTTQAPSAQRSESFAGATGQAISQLGATLGAVADRMRRVESLDKATTLQTEASKRTATLQMEVKKNPQDWTYEKIQKETEKIRGDTLGQINNIPDKELQIRTRSSIDTSIASGSLNMQNIRMKFDVRQSQQKTYEIADTLKENYIAGNPKQKQTAIEQFHFEIDQRVDNNVWTPKQGESLKESIVQEWREERVARAIEKNPQEVITELGKGKKGAYKDLTADRRRDFLQRALSEDKRQKEIQKLDYELKKNETEQQAVEKAASGDLSIQEINEMEARHQAGLPGGISKGLASALRKWRLSKESVDPLLKSRMAAKIHDDFYKLNIEVDDGDPFSTSATLAQLTQYRIDLIKARAVGGITQGTFTNKIKMITGFYNEALNGVVSGKFKNQKLTYGFWKNLWQTGEMGLEKKDWDDASEYLANRLETYVLENPNVEPERIPEKGKEIFKNYIRQKFPEIFFNPIPEDGALIMNDAGNKARIFPDGTIKEVE